MDTNQNVSKPEWLCAALIDFLPIVLIRGLVFVIINHVRVFSYCGSSWDNGRFSLHEPVSMESFIKINIGFLILSSVYLLLKDAFGLSLGKRIMGIKLQKNGADTTALWCVLRNVLLAVFFANGLLSYFSDAKNIVLGNLFPFYCVVELACVYFTNRTIGDNICQLKMVKKDDFTPGKINNRTYCIGTIIILYEMTSYLFQFSFSEILRNVDDVDMALTARMLINLCSTLISILVYSFLLYKLIKPKAFKWAAIVLFALLQLQYVSSEFILKSF